MAVEYLAEKCFGEINYLLYDSPNNPFDIINRFFNVTSLSRH